MPSTGTFSIVDYVVFIGFLVVFAGIGIYHAFGQSSSNQVLLGNRKFSIVPMALTVAASFLSAISVLGFPAEIYTFGTMFYWYAVMYCLAFPVSAYVLLPTIYRLKLTSAYHYLELRFSPSVRRVCSFIFSLQVMLYMAVVLYAPALALSQVTPLSMYTSIVVTGVLATFYTSLGGAKAVVYTSVLQMLLLISGLCCVAVVGASRVGGWSYIWQINQAGHRIQFDDFRVDPSIRHSTWSLVIGGSFMIWALFSANQMTVQRYISMPTLQSAQYLILLNIPFNMLALTLYAVIGLIMYATYALCDPMTNMQITAPDQLLPHFVMDQLGDLAGVPGLFVSAVYSAGLSTLAGGMNSLTAVIYEDVVKSVLHDDYDTGKTGSIITRCTCLLIGMCILALALLFSVLKSTVLQLSMTIFGVFGGPVLGAFTAGLLLPIANEYGALAGLVLSSLVNCVIGFGAFVMSTRAQPIGHVITNSSSCLMFWNNDSSNATEMAWHMFDEFELKDTYNRVVDNDGTTSGPLQLSYQYYTCAGVLVFWVVCLIVSIITRNYTSSCDVRLLAPVWHRWYSFTWEDDQEGGHPDQAQDNGFVLKQCDARHNGDVGIKQTDSSDAKLLPSQPEV